MKFSPAFKVCLEKSVLCWLATPLLEMTEGKFPFASLFHIDIQSVKPIIAPRYVLYPETSEAEQVESAKRLYGL